ncbi:hypothetical protein ACFX15_033455 [Malus domestica]|uniref:Uncharacterized protein n=1 Tax=Malus domestica TaxID=3750 RepID=A0A498JW62_MALDO|nr:hypothetical protein DVH24_030640 [Malus domestica]
MWTDSVRRTGRHAGRVKLVQMQQILYWCKSGPGRPRCGYAAVGRSTTGFRQTTEIELQQQQIAACGSRAAAWHAGRVELVQMQRILYWCRSGPGRPGCGDAAVGRSATGFRRTTEIELQQQQIAAHGSRAAAW